MSEKPHPDLIKVTEIFLIPSSFLVAALGTADTNVHRACVSTVGLIVSVLWWVCSQEAHQELLEENTTGSKHPRRTRILSWLPMIFLIGWLISVVAHAAMWNQKLGAF